MKNLMGHGKWLILVGASMILQACATSPQYYYTNTPAQSHQAGVANLFLGLAKLGKLQVSDLAHEDQMRHEQAVMFALNYLDNGQVVHWYGKDNISKGRVKVVFSYPQGSGVCRELYSEIQSKDQAHQFKETACQELSQAWVFDTRNGI